MTVPTRDSHLPLGRSGQGGVPPWECPEYFTPSLKCNPKFLCSLEQLPFFLGLPTPAFWECILFLFLNKPSAFLTYLALFTWINILICPESPSRVHQEFPVPPATKQGAFLCSDTDKRESKFPCSTKCFIVWGAGTGNNKCIHRHDNIG